MEIHNRVPSLQGLLDGRTENTYSDKATQAESPARESKALWTFRLMAGPRSLSVCLNSISYTPVNADKGRTLRFHFSFRLTIFRFPSASLNLGCMIKCAELSSWPLVCVQTCGACMSSLVHSCRGFSYMYMSTYSVCMHARKLCINHGPRGCCAAHNRVQLTLPTGSSHTDCSWSQREVMREFGFAPILGSPSSNPLVSLP